jgi:class 3 adenylate cyclase/tetratricopeptide (TPR) repeat protein
MRCSKCGSDNREGRKFCTTCGTALVAACPKCGASIQLGESFCGECGTALSEAAPAAAADTAPGTSSAGGERRHLTVLFCDLVGSTEIAARLDPEEWREIVADYHRAAAQAIERFGGHVAQYLGDGVMAYFGYPEAHDNDAERAARAGLAILDAISTLNQPSTRPELSARIGIDSGAVVVGASAGKDADVFGDTPNIAARLQAAAEPGTVVITDATHRLVSGLFVVDQLGAQALRGIERPVQLYRVIQPSGLRGRLEAAAATRGLTPFVGREDELRQLMSRWERALDGEGQVALIMGEAGIGKSRLVQRFHEQIGGTPHTWIEAHAGAFFQNTPFYPVTELLRRFLGGNGGKPAEEQLAQLEPGLKLAGLKLAETIPLIAPLLNLPLSDKYPPLPLPPEQQRRRLLATLVEWVLGAARVQPLILATEDLHWADGSTLELIQLLVEQGAMAKLLLLYTARPEFRAQWPPRTHYTQVTLGRLSARNVRAMIEEVAARKAMSDETVATVIERTGGVPLFVEELTRAVLESGNARLTEREIPVTLHDSLMARLDRLGPAKEIIQIGAVIGGEFSYELLHAVHPIAEENLQRALSNLADAELLYVRGIAPDATYQLKHALICDAAYEALLKSRRKDLHRLVAHTLSEKFAAFEETQPEVIARHWTEAGETEQAIAQWLKAGNAAELRNAFLEAQESYQQALALLILLPESSERDVRELQFRNSLVSILHMTRGWTAPETMEAAERGWALAKKSGNVGHLVGSMTTRCLHIYLSGDLSFAGALADQALELARREGSPTQLAFLHMFQLTVHSFRGDLAGAENYFAAGLKFFDDPGFRQHPAGTVINVLGTAGWNAWILGRADVARERVAKIMAVVNRANPHDLPWSDYQAASLCILMRENEQAEMLAARALEPCEKHKFPNEAAYLRCILGHARAELGRTAEGIAMIREGIAGSLKAGSRITITRYMNSLAAAQRLDGAISDALDTIEQALQFNPAELIDRPETLRLRGELRLEQGHAELAEGDFREAVALARTMGAKAWELRATMSLARLLASHGRRDEALAALAEIYGWFTEGFDTVDLKEAKALLDKLQT